MNVDRSYCLANLQIAGLAALAMASCTACADSAITRAEVKAELAEAQRTGDLPAGGESGLKRYEANPGRYPAHPAEPGKTRAQVQEELAEALRRGEYPLLGDLGLTPRQLRPSAYPPGVAMPGKTREQVKAELAEARRLGDLQVGEDGRTLAERDPARYAVARAQKAADEERLAANPNSR